jgi:hypothetical protein
MMPQMQEMFDGPSALTSCSIRRVSTVPLQPLFLLNSDFVNARARSVVERILGQGAEGRGNGVTTTQPEQINQAFMLILNRNPDDEERARSKLFVNAVASNADAVEALSQFCHALLNLNEFAYIP